MGEFNKDPNQSGTGKEEQGDKSAFGQFDKGQQGQQDFGEKGQDTGQGKEQFGQEKTGQQFAADKSQFVEEKPEESTGGKDQQQQKIQNEGQRQQGDEDLGDDSIDNQNLK